MKSLLKSLFTENQRKALADVRNRIYLGFNNIILKITRKMPDRLIIFLKENTNIIRKMDCEKSEIYLNIESEFEYNVRLNSCKKEPEIVRWMQDHFIEGDVIYDIGANVGAYSLVASKLFGGKVTVYAFEPGYLSFAQLCKNIAINNCQDSIKPLQIALSNKTNIEYFNYSNLVPGGAMHALGEPVNYAGNSFSPVLRLPVLAFRIDDFIKQYNLPIPNHIKLDVDGIELEILKGAEDTLNNKKLKSIFVEVEEGSGLEKVMSDYLSLKGFVLFAKYQYLYGKGEDDTDKVYNYLFTRKG